MQLDKHSIQQLFLSALRWSSLALISAALLACGTESSSVTSIGKESGPLAGEEKRSAAAKMDAARIATAAIGDVLTFDVFDGDQLHMEVLSIERSVAGLEVLIGDLDGPGDGRGYIVRDLEGNVLEVEIVDGASTYVIEPRTSGTVLSELETAGLPKGDEDPLRLQRRTPRIARLSAALVDSDPSYIFSTLTDNPEEDGTQVDVLALYTPRVLSRGTATPADDITEATVEARFAANLAAANQALADSGVDLALHGVGIAATTYAETGNNGECPNMLQAMVDDTLGGVDIDTLREAREADIVLLIATRCINNSGSSRTGQAVNVATDASDYDDLDNGYAVSAYGSMAGGGLAATAHEIGHLLGAAHNVEQSQPAGYFADSFGYCSTTGAPGASDFRTIMSYDCGGATDPTLVGVFSDDTLTITRPNGAGGTVAMATGNGNQDNARALQETRVLAANWIRRTKTWVKNSALLLSFL